METINQGDGHQETQHHDEKKSVLKKVKAKAKKIKDTVTGHHGNHDHDHDHDNDDDEMERDHEAHGVPCKHIYSLHFEEHITIFLKKKEKNPCRISTVTFRDSQSNIMLWY